MDVDVGRGGDGEGGAEKRMYSEETAHDMASTVGEAQNHVGDWIFLSCLVLSLSCMKAKFMDMTW
jgi:hypothetical protein